MGVKEASGSVDQVKAIAAGAEDSFAIYSGDDGLTLDFMKEGACGVVSVASHIVGSKMQDMIEIFYRSEIAAYDIQRSLTDLFKVLFISANPVPVKAALRLLGYQVGSVRLPLVELNADELTQVKLSLKTLGLLA